MLWVVSICVILFLASNVLSEDTTLTCKNVRTSLRKLKQIPLNKKDFIIKPVLGETVDYCNKLELTCCSKGMEQKLSLEANRNFKQDLGYFVMQQSMNCESTKVQLAHAVQEAFKNSFAVVIQEMESTNIGEVNDLVSLLYNYLLSYSETEDICRLPETIDVQLQRIAQHVLHQSDSRCLQMVVQPYYATFKRSILELLEPLLGRLKLLINGTKYKSRLMQFMASYRAPPHCVKQLMGMTFCSTCRGLTAQPCHSVCLNTIQGCLIDMADAYWSIKDMLKMLDRIIAQLNLSKINVLMEQVGTKLKSYILELKRQSTVIKQKLKKSNCLLLDSRRSVSFDNFLPSVPHAQPSLQGIYIHQKLMESISDELKCFNYQLARISSIPEQMCTRRYLTQRSNIGCWTGSSYGTYTAPVANFSRQAVQQNTNIEYINSSLPPMHELNSDIIQFTQNLHISFTNDFVCDNVDDDEDCTPYIATANCKISDELEFSGSGEIMNVILDPKRENYATLKLPTGEIIRTFPTLPPIKLPDNVTNVEDSNSVNTNTTNETSHSGAYTIDAHLLTILVIMLLAIH